MKTSADIGGARGLRADAQRSTDALLVAARELFTSTGVDATTREIAERAGVGMGTLFRRFPQRSDLIAAVFYSEMEDCAQAALTLSADHPPFEALAQWMQVYVQFLSTKPGLARALSSGDPAFVGSFARFGERLRPAIQNLFAAAVAAGEVRPEIDAIEILCATTTLCMTPYDGKPDHAGQMVALLVGGLRLHR